MNLIQQVINSGPESETLTGAGSPSSTPSNIGDHYIDTTNDRVYVALGTSASTDWKKVVIQ